MSDSPSPFQVLLLGPYRREQRVSSMTFFINTLEEGLREKGIPVTVTQPEVKLGSLPVPVTQLAKLTAAADKLLLFPGQLKHLIRSLEPGPPLVVHIVDQAYSNYSMTLKTRPHLITCHDVIAIQASSGESSEHKPPLRTRLYQRMLKKGLTHSPWVAAISSTTRDHLCRFTGKPEEQVPIVYNGMHHPYHPMSQEEAQALLEPMLPAEFGSDFYMHIGINIWYKNRPGVLDIYREWLKQHPDSSRKLLMVGPAPTEELREQGADLEAQGRLHWSKRLSNEQVNAAYSLAAALIFPSFMEGFGWPLVEAMASACPVFTSDRDPMMEIASPAARFFDPADAAAAAQVLIDGETAREEMKRSGIQRAKDFGREQMLEGYIDVYRKVLGLTESPSKN